MSKSATRLAVLSALLSLIWLCFFANMACRKKATNVLISPSQSIKLETVPAQSVHVLPECPNLKPVCAEGLLGQHVSADTINRYLKRDASAVAGTCRYMEPPRCYLHEKRACKQQCTP
jgi:hypothetical protein